MSEYIEVPFEGNAQDKAVLLLAAAEELGVGQEVVQTRTGAFYVPSEVNEKAFGVSTRQSSEESAEEKPKRTAKKSSPRKTQE